MTDPMDHWRTPKGVRRAFSDGRYGQVHYRIARPNGPTQVPLICFHLSPGSSRMYAPFLQRMGTDRVAIAADTIGFGESSPPPEPKEIEDFAGCMGEVLDSLGIGTVDVLGTHTGSEIAVELANQRPEQVRRLVLVSAPVFTDEELDGFRTEYKGVPLAPDGSHLKIRWDMHWHWRGPGMDANLNQLTLAESVHSGERYEWGHQAAFNYPFGARLQEVRQPILVLNPEDDLATQTKRADGLMQNGRIVDLPKETFGHGMFETHPDEVAAIVREFLDDDPAEDDAVNPDDAGKKTIASPATAADFVRREFFDSRWGQFHYRSISPPEAARTQRPLICFHASPRSGDAFINIMKVLGTDRIVMAPDTPGFGESEPPPAPVEISDFADVMADFIMKQGFDEVDVFGFHTGSEVATELWHKLPKVVRHIMMYSAPIFSEEELADFRDKYTPVEFTDDGMHNVERWQFFWPWLGPNQPIENYAAAFNETLRWGPAYSWGHRAAFNYAMAKRLKQVTVPVLVLNPEDDLYEQSKRATEVIQKGRVHDMPGFGHGMMDTRTEEVAAVIREFVAD
jgi:pimeloyl-ACP methyl ester carboxylesterase